MPAYLYILRLRSGQLYIGVTTDLDRRWHEHRTGNGCRTTKADPPVALVYREEHPDISTARSRENQLNRWSRTKHEALVVGELQTLQQSAKSHD